MIRELANRINAAEQRMRIERFDIAQAERQLEAVARIPGQVIPADLVKGFLPEARDRVLPRVNLTGRAPYLGTT